MNIVERFYATATLSQTAVFTSRHFARAAAVVF